MRSGFTHNYAERYVERFTVTPRSEKLVTTHNVSLRIQKALGPSLLHASPAEVPTHNNREKGDYWCKNLDMGTVCRHATPHRVSVVAVRYTPIKFKTSDGQDWPEFPMGNIPIETI